MDVGGWWRARDAVVKQNNDGILYLFKKNKVTFHGRGSFAGAVDGGYEIVVQGATEATLRARHVIVATGRTRALPARRSTKSASCPTTERCASVRCRSALGVIGAGVIGLEMGSVWRRLGAEVTVLGGTARLPGRRRRRRRQARR